MKVFFTADFFTLVFKGLQIREVSRFIYEAYRLIFKSNNGTSFSKEQAIDLMVSLSATDANSEKKWRGFYNSLSQTELQSEWDEYWKN